MQTPNLSNIFDTLVDPPGYEASEPTFSARRIPGNPRVFVARDLKSHACLIFDAGVPEGPRVPAIRLANLDAQFAVKCRLTEDAQTFVAGYYTIVRCTNPDSEVVRYFYGVGEALLQLVGDQFTHETLAHAVSRLADVFQKMSRPPSRSLNGLFGELFLILRSKDVVSALSAWHLDSSARFDFVMGDQRLEVKTSAGRARIHTFSYDQCSPPEGTQALVASLFVEHAAGGLSLEGVLREISDRVGHRPDLILKLHELTADALGAQLASALLVEFDTRVSDASLGVYEAASVPAVRGTLPGGVSEVRFRSDLGACTAVAADEIGRLGGLFADLLGNWRNL